MLRRKIPAMRQRPRWRFADSGGNLPLRRTCWPRCCVQPTR